jgi:tetratricopeptide (TPR) repeat protein
MPFTINGIGTRYAGRRNGSARYGTCEFCKRQTTLSSYETREFFCIIYVPLIPITRYRIFDECASCRKHRRATMKEFQRSVDATLAPLRERVRHEPQNAAAHAELIRTLFGMRLITEAEAAARAGVAANPNDAALQLLAGQILEIRGDQAAAKTFLERAVALDPSNGAARLELGRCHFVQNDWASAVVQLSEARRSSNDPAASLLLAESYERLERWQEALSVWQQMGGPAADKALVKRVALCKQKLGYPLSDNERRAARRWWPFGRRRAKTPARPAKVGGGPSKIVVYGGGFLLVMMALSLGALGFINLTRTNVWFDSTRTDVAFTIDGAKFTNRAPFKQELSFGRHKVLVADSKGKTLEDGSIDVRRGGPIVTLAGKRAYVYNAGTARLYRREAIVYSTHPDKPNEVTLIAGQHFFPVDDADYLFETPPKTVELSSSSSSTTKISFTTAESLLADYARMEAGEGKSDDAVTLMRGVLRFDPCDARSREALTEIFHYVKNNDAAAMATVKEGLRECDSVLTHRLYQNEMLVSGKRDALIAEYASRAAANPSSAMHHYLLGRVAKDHAAADAAFRDAIRIDPQFAWGHAGLGYSALGAGRYDEATNEIATALSQHFEKEQDFLLIYADAAAAAGRAKEAASRIESFGMRTASAWEARFRLELAMRNWIAARQMVDERAKFRMDAITWEAGRRLFETMGDDAALKKHFDLARSTKELALAAAEASVETLITRGEYAAAARQDEASAATLRSGGVMFELYVAAVKLIERDSAGAAAALAIANADIDKGDLDTLSRQTLHKLALALTPGADATVLVDELGTENVDLLTNAYFFLGARASAAGDAARARELFGKSMETAFDYGFPRLAAKRLAARG